MAESYEKWGSWGSWHNPRYNKPAGTVTYISTRTRWRYYYDRRPSQVVRTEKRYKTEKDPRVGEPHRPPRPQSSTPVKTVPTPEYIPPPMKTVTLGPGESFVGGEVIPAKQRSVKEIPVKGTPRELTQAKTRLREMEYTKQTIDPTRSYYTDETKTRWMTGGTYIQNVLNPAIREHKQYINQFRKVEPVGKKGIDILGGIKGGIAGFLTAGPEFAYSSLTRPIDKYYWQPWTPEMYGMVEGKKRSLETKWERGDVLGLLGETISAPLVMVPLTYGLGAGIGAFKQTAIGSKALLVSRGVWKTGAKAGKPLYTVTLSKTVEAGVVGYGTYETGKALMKDPSGTLFHLAATMPFVIPFYRAGHQYGMGYVQRKAALGKVSGLDRTRQVAGYEMMDAAYKLGEPGLKRPVYDLTQIQRIDPYSAMRVSEYLRSEQRWGMLGGRPRIGGSASMKMQMGDFFRTDTLPKGLRQYALQRQSLSSAGYRPLIGTTGALDIDLLVYARLGGLKRASYLRQPHVVDIHAYKIGDYLWGGKAQLPSTKGYIDSFQKVNLLSVREQFIRKVTSILPSEKVRTGYRSYKDIPDMFDIGDVLRFQKGGSKLGVAMEKYIHPERHPVPKVSVSEKIFGRIGKGDFIEVSPGGKFHYKFPSYPKYPSYGMGFAFGGYGGYSAKRYKLIVKSSRYPSIIPPSVIYPLKKYKPLGKTPSYKPPAMPSIISPSYSPPYKTPGFPSLSPPSYSPPYKTPSYPPSTSPPIPPTKISFDEYIAPRRSFKDSLMKGLGLRYRYREFKIPNIDKLTRGFNL